MARESGSDLGGNERDEGRVPARISEHRFSRGGETIREGMCASITAGLLLNKLPAGLEGRLKPVIRFTKRFAAAPRRTHCSRTSRRGAFKLVGIN